MTTCMFVRGDRGVCFHGEEVVRMVHFRAIQLEKRRPFGLCLTSAYIVL